MFHIQTKYTIFVTNYGKEYSCIKKNGTPSHIYTQKQIETY